MSTGHRADYGIAIMQKKGFLLWRDDQAPSGTKHRLNQ
jgi:hypothetical protein